MEHSLSVYVYSRGGLTGFVDMSLFNRNILRFGKCLRAHGLQLWTAAKQQISNSARTNRTLNYGLLALAIGASAVPLSCTGLDSDRNVVTVEKAEGKPPVDMLDALRPTDKDFVRIDEKVLAEASEFVANHALHTSLRGDSLVETFEVYVNPKTSEIHVVAHFGCGLNGHPTVVHGGILALAFDESFGWLLHAGLNTAPAFTANLTVNYRFVVLSSAFFNVLIVLSVGKRLQKTPPLQ